MPDPASDPKPSLIANFRHAFVSGALLLAPLVVTWWAFINIIGGIGGAVRTLYSPPILADHPAFAFLWDIAATVAVIVFVTALGYVSRDIIGKFFVTMAERFMLSIPGLNAVYGTVKQIVETFGKPNRQLFNKVVMVEFPRKGAWVIGFLTGKAAGEIKAKVATEDSGMVFIPTTPNPTSGFLLLVPVREIVELDMTVGEGMKMIISGGAVVPSWPHSNPAEPAK